MCDGQIDTYCRKLATELHGAFWIDMFVVVENIQRQRGKQTADKQ